ncbi:hypothetical protein, partial [Escherichia coli]|uniref:hypothetical protein n=1 Tax=Escherichia coli TaxID=562 RepID=UPI001BAFA1C6
AYRCNDKQITQNEKYWLSWFRELIQVAAPPLSNASFSVVLCDRVMLTTVAVTLLSTTLG